MSLSKFQPVLSKHRSLADTLRNFWLHLQEFTERKWRKSKLWICMKESIYSRSLFHLWQGGICENQSSGMLVGHLNGWTQSPSRSFWTIAILWFYVNISPTLPKSFDSVSASWNRAIGKCWWVPCMGFQLSKWSQEEEEDVQKYACNKLAARQKEPEAMLTSSVAARKTLPMISAFLGNIR